MIRPVAVLALAGLVAMTGSGLAAAAALETHALVQIVPPVDVQWARPDTAWRVQTDADATWQVRLETRRPDGTLVELRALEPAKSTGGDQDLATVNCPPSAADAPPAHVTLVLCRE